jgi:hypothetical protein
MLPGSLVDIKAPHVICIIFVTPRDMELDNV